MPFRVQSFDHHLYDKARLWKRDFTMKRLFERFNIVSEMEYT